MGNIKCCDVRQDMMPDLPIIQRQQLHIQLIYQLAPQAESKYNTLVKAHNNDLFLEVPPTHIGNTQTQSRQGYVFLPQVDAYYNGEWNQQNKPEGRGRIIFKNGSMLIGKFKQFKCNYEMCHYFFKDGSYYCGAIKDNRLTGKGKLVTKLLEYEGQWDNNLPDGKGEEYMSNGDRYIGTFHKGNKHGTHCNYKWFYHKRFAEYDGSFEDGLIRGKGTLTLKNGCKIQGIFTGQTIDKIILQSSICRYKGNLVKGKLQGKGILQILPRNQVFQGYYKEGQLHGHCTHVDGKGRKNQCFIFKKKKLAKVVGLNQQEIADIIKCIEEVYSRIQSHQQALKQLNVRFSGQYLCELIQPFAIQSSHHKYMVIHFNRHTIRILAGS